MDMNWRHRAATILLLCVLLLGGFGLLTADLSAGQQPQVQGVITEASNPINLLEGVAVTLLDALGQKSSAGVVTGPDGSFAFTPTPGFYKIIVKAAGFFDNETEVFRFDSTENLVRDMEMEEMPEAIHDLTVNVEDDMGAGLGGAFVEVYNVTPERTQFIVAGMTNGAFARPDSDASNDTDGDSNNWTASTGTLLYAVMDETIPDESDHTASPAADGSQGFEVGLSDVADPQVSDNHIVRYQYRRTTGSSQTIDLDVEFRQGSTVIAGWSHFGVDTPWQMAEQTLTAAQADSITDYTDLRLRFISTRDSVFGGTAQISWAELAVPLAGGVTFPSSLWTGTFEMRTSKEGFVTNVTTIAVSGDTVRAVRLDPGIKLVGIAREPDETFIAAGLVAFLYNVDGGTPPARRLLAANVTGASYTFYAYAGNFTLIVDADGRAANITPLQVFVGMSPQEKRIDRKLNVSLDERVDTEIQFVQGDWNRLNLWRNLTFNEDSTFPGLPFDQVRNLRLQIDMALGDGNGMLNDTEQEAFRSFLVEVGPKYVDTGDFFSTNSESYRSDLNGTVTDYNVSFTSFDLTAGPVQVASLANYTAIDTTIPADKERYFVNVTAPHDVEAEVRVNTTYAVQVVLGYERETETISGSVDIRDYVRIFIDPLVAPGTFRVDMEVAKALAGTARVLVVAPPDRFTETNASVEKYTAIIPTNESMTFSAEESTDPNSPDGRVNPDSNFTWTFTNDTAEATFGIEPNVTAFGIRPNVTFAIFGNYSGNLTIEEVGNNVTYRNFTLHVDGILPIAFLENNITGFGIDANNTTISIREGDLVEFFAGNSTDRVHDEMVGVVRAYRWDFDGDGVVDATGRSVDWTFETPGEFTVNLTVVDQAGHESLNATLTAIVSDTSPPDVEFRILDEDFQEVLSLVEQVVYFFDGSDTTDNLDSVQNLTFEWDFGDDTTASGVNVTHTYTDSDNFDVVLNVTDQAGNEGNATRSVVVGVDPSKRPDLVIDPKVMRIDPASPEESTFFSSVSLFITFNVTNVLGRAPANNVSVAFFAFQFGQSPGAPETIINLVFRDVNRVETDNTLAAGETKIVEFSWITGPLGNYTLRANVTDPEEPDLFGGPPNSVERQVDIREAAWKQPLLIGSIIAVIVGIPVALFLRRRFRGRGRERITK